MELLGLPRRLTSFSTRSQRGVACEQDGILLELREGASSWSSFLSWLWSCNQRLNSALSISKWNRCAGEGPPGSGLVAEEADCVRDRCHRGRDRDWNRRARFDFFQHLRLPLHVELALQLLLTEIGVSGVFGGIILVLYFSAAESYYGQSLGKALTRLKVVTDADERASFSSALIRNTSKIHWILLLLDVIVGLATASDYHRKFSDTYVHVSVVSV